ncbi:MAG: T6SS effector amidase Tae4 family protein [Pseudomonadota bacterium]
MTLWADVKALPKTQLPRFQDLWSAYPLNDNDPCDREKVQWQCAVYLSAALAKTGIIGEKGFDGSQGYKPNPTCPGINEFKDLHLARGSQSLADFLHHRLFPPKPYPGGYSNRNAGVNAKAALLNKKGIIFYKHISGFTNQGGAQGSHIDLWNGPNKNSRYEQFKLGEYFLRSQKIQFWEFDR